MELNEKTIADIAGQLGLKPGRQITKEEVRRLENKSDAELASDILRLKEQLNVVVKLFCNTCG